MYKKVVVVLIAVSIVFAVVVGLGITVMRILAPIPAELTVSKLIGQGKLYNPHLTPERIAIFNTISKSGWQQKLYVNDEQKVDEFLDFIKDKPALRLRDADVRRIMNRQDFPIYHIEFDLSDKFTEIMIFEDGRVVFSIHTSEYRNKSRIYWLRWKIGNFGTRYSALTFASAPDSTVAEAAQDLFEVAKPAH